jgi:hypothetical protein
MWLLSAKSTFTFEMNQTEEEVLELLKDQLLGKRTFEIDTLFGKNEATYEGSVESKIITFERLNESIKMTIAPKCKIALRSFNENQTLVQVTCKLSMYWVVFLYFIYSVLFLGVTLKSIYTNDFFTIYTVLKLVGGLILFNAIIFGTHYNELGHYKSILSRICGANAK